MLHSLKKVTANFRDNRYYHYRVHHYITRRMFLVKSKS